MVWDKLSVGLWDATYRWGGGGFHKYIGRVKYSLAGFKKTFTKIEAHEGMDERMVIDLSI